jgi:proliferating cell nuclear antigen
VLHHAPCTNAAGNERLAEFELKLMDITSENLGIPDAEYSATVGPPPYPLP